MSHFLGHSSHQPWQRGSESSHFTRRNWAKKQKLGWRETEGYFPVNMLSKSDTFSTKILQSCDGKMEMACKQEGWQSCSSHSHQTKSHPPTPTALSWAGTCVLHLPTCRKFQQAFVRAQNPRERFAFLTFGPRDLSYHDPIPATGCSTPVNTAGALSTVRSRCVL